MTWNDAATEWLLLQGRCDNCKFAPRHLSCASLGSRQQLAFVRHNRTAIGEGVFLGMDATIPGVYSDGSQVVFCALLGRGDLERPRQGGEQHEVQRLVTKAAEWSPEAESLVLDFRGRSVLSSAKNFQMALAQKPAHIICQYGKVGTSTFGLDFRFPLSIAQAFALSVTTIFWK